jgi:serine/threonine protein phosphatase PrpC
MITDDAISQILQSRDTAQAALDLIDAANEGNGKDNITAVVLRIGDIPAWTEDTKGTGTT